MPTTMAIKREINVYYYYYYYNIEGVKNGLEFLSVCNTHLNGMGGACGTYGGRERCAQGFGGET